MDRKDKIMRMVTAIYFQASNLVVMGSSPIQSLGAVSSAG
jgi:hypothetical protein